MGMQVRRKRPGKACLTCLQLKVNYCNTSKSFPWRLLNWHVPSPQKHQHWHRRFWISYLFILQGKVYAASIILVWRIGNEYKSVSWILKTIQKGKGLRIPIIDNRGQKIRFILARHKTTKKSCAVYFSGCPSGHQLTFKQAITNHPSTQ